MSLSTKSVNLSLNVAETLPPAVRRDIELLMNSLHPGEIINADLKFTEVNNSYQAILTIKGVSLSIDINQATQLPVQDSTKIPLQVVRVTDKLYLQPAVKSNDLSEMPPPLPANIESKNETSETSQKAAESKDNNVVQSLLQLIERVKPLTELVEPAVPIATPRVEQISISVSASGETNKAAKGQDTATRQNTTATIINAQTVQSSSTSSVAQKPISDLNIKVDNATELPSSRTDKPDKPRHPIMGNQTRSQAKMPNESIGGNSNAERNISTQIKAESLLSRQFIPSNSNGQISSNSTQETKTPDSAPKAIKEADSPFVHKPAPVAISEAKPVIIEHQINQTQHSSIEQQSKKEVGVLKSASEETVKSKPDIELPATQTTKAENIDPKQTNKIDNQSTPVQHFIATTAASSSAVPPEWRKPDYKPKIEIPNAEKFPILAQSLHSQQSRLVRSSSSLGESLNRLFTQLNRLNQWAADNKRPLRTQQGQPLNKALKEVQQGIQELRRYTPSAKNITTAEGLKKALKRSGIFLEQKQNPSRNESKSTMRPANLHQDIKANVQRLVSTSLYHAAALTRGTPAQVATTQSGQVGSNSLYQASDPQKPEQGQTKPLLNAIKQRLEGLSRSAVPNELLPQLQALLKTVLTDANRAIQRTQLHQISNLKPDSAPPQWFFELPFMVGEKVENLQLLLQREKKAQTRDVEPGWSLMLQFDLHKLGKIRCLLHWQANHVTLNFLAEHQATKDFLVSEIDVIKDKIQSKSIVLEELTVEQKNLNNLQHHFTEQDHV